MISLKEIVVDILENILFIIQSIIFAALVNIQSYLPDNYASGINPLLSAYLTKL